MESSPATPRVGPEINTSRLLRLLRPYTSHLGQLERLIGGDTDHSAYSVIPQGISLTLDRQLKPESKRTYGKNHRKGLSTRTVSLSQGSTTLPDDDVFCEKATIYVQHDASQRSRLLKSHIGVARHASTKDKHIQKVHQQATSVFSAFRRICEVAKPSSYRAKEASLESSIHRKKRIVPTLSMLCATIIGHNLEGYVKAEWMANERQKCGVGPEDSGFQFDSEDEDEAKDEYQDQTWRIERLQEWYDALPVYFSGTVIIQQAINLALSLPNHPVRTDLLWNMLEVVCERKTSSNLRPVLEIVLEDTMTTNSAIAPLILSGIVDLFSPKRAPLEVERVIIGHMSNRKKYLALHPTLMDGIAHCGLAASMVAAGIRFTYNTDNQRQIEDLDSYRARWISLWTQTLPSASVVEEDEAWLKIFECLTDVGFLSDSLPVDNSPDVYLVTLVVALLDTLNTRSSQTALLRKSLRCLRSNPDIDFNVLHPSVLPILGGRMLREPRWKTECPHMTRWFLAHLQRNEDCLYYRSEILCWISELEVRMPEVEELDVETRMAYRKLGYVWDTTFDCWVHMTPRAKMDVRYSGDSDQDDLMSDCGSGSSSSSSGGSSAGSERSMTFNGDRSSPTVHMPTSPPTPPAVTITTSCKPQVATCGSRSPISRIPAFSSPFVKSPFVRSTMSPRDLLGSKRITTDKILARSVYATPLQPTRKIQSNTVESIDPLDDIEELDKTTPVLPKRISIRSERPRLLKELDQPSSELDGSDPLADQFSDLPLEFTWKPIDRIATSVVGSKRKALTSLGSQYSKK
ncbi:hypothetical protein QFC22_005318 [Naganishia vaughanmartiniae]|uniref:Uncharacterized protein n=1 Tax=Naganishia vaughanmartiniae TaxID=1424756 RepID=A0ACC2WUY8_9TREE|nr:hypothetical protein QFC22_005318 [Naganishia vaughanmartiniae]